MQIALGLAVFYLVTANVLLRTHLLRDAISSSPESLLLDYDSAYTLIPGRVHVDRLTIRGADRHVQWLLTLEQADARISLLDLLRRRFHATRVVGSGFTMWTRLRVDPVHDNPDVLAALPAIPGFMEPPALDFGPDPPPLTDAAYDLWSIQLDDVRVDRVRELWIHQIRGRGDMSVRGRWFFRPTRWLDVGPATLDVHAVDLTYGRETLAAGTEGSMAATIHPFDIQQTKGLEYFNHVSTIEHLQGIVMAAAALQALVHSDDARVTRGQGPFDARLIMDHGAFAPGTLVAIDLPDAEVEGVGLAIDARVRCEFTVHPTEQGSLATFDTSAVELRVARRGVPQARVAAVDASLSTHHLRFTDAFDDTGFGLDVRGAETDDLGVWAHFVPAAAPLAVRSGPVTAHAHAEGSLAEGRGHGALGFVARHLTAAPAGYAVAADVTGDVQITRFDLPPRTLSGVATLIADAPTVHLGRATVAAGRVETRVELRSVVLAERRVDLSGSAVVVRDASVRSGNGGTVLVVPALTVAAPELQVAGGRLLGRATLDLPSARMDLAWLGDLVALPGGLAVQGGALTAKLSAELDVATRALKGDGRVWAQGFRGRAGETPFFADGLAALRVRPAEGRPGVMDLSGTTLAVSRAGTGDGAAPDRTWWGHLDLRAATLSLDDGARFLARVHLTARDATPATVLVAQNTGVPAWAANAFRMPSLVADAEVEVAPSALVMRSLVARGGNQSLRMEYTRLAGRPDGAVLADLGWIEVGYDLTEGSTGLVLFGPESWFDRRRAPPPTAVTERQRSR
ncbi:MAG TPA: hypothetical protein VIF15_15085 [Polyangiaceae bacterium]